MSAPDADCPPEVAEHAALTVAYVERALGVRLEFNSETLPVLDHYLRGVPAGQAATVALVASTAGAYFGEVVRHHVGGRWELGAGTPEGWRFILPTGLSFLPARYALGAITRGQGQDGAAETDELADLDSPDMLREMIDNAIAAMGDIEEDVFYSLCGRLDTLEHLHEVVAAHAAQAMDRRAAESGEPIEN
jgi:hypothetical protein